MSLELNYFYGSEADQFRFYRIPKALFTDERFKGLSVDAKVLYGMMLDRMGLSIRNGWLDSEQKVYIYFTLEDTMSTLGCGKDKAIRLYKELDKENGVGLIERRKQGQGKPARIYVKNFTLQPGPSHQTPPPPPAPPEPPKSASVYTPNAAPDVPPAPPSNPVQASEDPKSGSPDPAIPTQGFLENRVPEYGISDRNETEKNKTEWNDTESSIYPPAPTPPPRRRSRQTARDRMDQMDACREQIRENIGYEDILQERPYDRDLIDGYVEQMVEACCSQRGTIRVNQEETPTQAVRSRLLKLDREHILYVLESLQRNTTLVGNVKAYTLSALYNAPVTISQYYASQVSHDMAQGFPGRPGA